MIKNEGISRSPKSGFAAAFDRFLGVIYPRGIKCIVCDDELNTSTPYGLCDECILPINNQNTCQRCGVCLSVMGNYCETCKRGERVFDEARSALVYEGAVAALIQGLKYNCKRFLATYLAEFMHDTLKEACWQVDVIVPVPLSQQRLDERGYNQAEELAAELSQKSGLRLERLLVKNRDTQKQTSLSWHKRAENVRGCYELLQGADAKDKSILLVDDVLTTGASANECATILKKAGAKTVLVLVAASPVNKIT